MSVYIHMRERDRYREGGCKNIPLLGSKSIQINFKHFQINCPL